MHAAYIYAIKIQVHVNNCIGKIDAKQNKTIGFYKVNVAKCRKRPTVKIMNDCNRSHLDQGHIFAANRNNIEI